MHTEERTLDLLKREARSGQIKPIILRRGETGSTQIKINVTSDGAPYALSSYTARMCAYLPDEKFVKDAAHVTKSANYITYTVHSDLTSAAGDIRVCYVELKNGAEVLTTDSVPIVVLDDVPLNGELAEEYTNIIDEMLDKLESMIQKSNDATAKTEGAIKAANDTNEQIKSNETARQTAENARQAAEAQRQRDETARQTAERSRSDAEAERVKAEAARVAAELERASAEAERVAAELERVKAEAQRVTDQAKNNADQAANNLSAAQIAPHVCIAGEYDAETGKPTVGDAPEGRIYLVPTGAAGDDRYTEWMRLGDSWEKVGTSSGGEIAYVTTDQIDQVAADASPIGTTLLNLTGVSYFWAKIKEWATGAFRNKSDKIQTADIADAAVTSAKLGPSAVGSAALAANAVTSAKIEDGAVQFADLDEAVQGRITDLEDAWDSATPAILQVPLGGFIGYYASSAFRMRVPIPTGAKGVTVAGYSGNIQPRYEGRTGANFDITGVEASIHYPGCCALIITLATAPDVNYPMAIAGTGSITLALTY